MPPGPLGAILQENLKQTGYAVRLARIGNDLITILQEEKFDLILLYLAQSDSDTFELCATVRDHSHIPVILLSAHKNLNELVYGLSVGADAYLAMPFSIAELDLRMQATLRRAGQSWRRYQPSQLQAPITLDHVQRSVQIRGHETELTRIEYQLLNYLMRHSGRPVSKHTLAEVVWGFVENQDFNFIEVSMWRLRKKIEVDPSRPQVIVTVRGVGYQLNLPPESAALFKRHEA